MKLQAHEHASTAARAALKAQQKAREVVERIQKEDDDRKKKISDAARELRKQKQLQAQCRRAEPHKREAEEHARRAACAAQQAQRHVKDLVAKIEQAKQAEQAKREPQPCKTRGKCSCPKSGNCGTRGTTACNGSRVRH